MEYEFYRHEEATDEEFAEITSCFRQILSEDKDLCTGAQKNLNSGIFLNGELHPQAEKVSLSYWRIWHVHTVTCVFSTGTAFLPGTDTGHRDFPP